MAIADLDRDGRPDLVVANRSGSVSVFLGLGDGTFRPRVDYSVARTPEGIAVADLDHDSRLDIVVVTYGTWPDVAGTAVVLLGNGDGTLGAPASFPSGTEGRSVCIADLDRDGDPDVVTEKAALLGNGDGTFGPPHEFGTWNDNWVAVGDLDGDGILDVATSNPAYPPEYEDEVASPIVSVRLGLGDGTFGPTVGFGYGNNAQSVAVADMDRDGRPDLIVGNHANDDTGSDFRSTVSVLRNLGGGTFGGPAFFATGNNPYSVAVADFDADGWPDIATTNFTGDPDFNPNSVSVLLANRNGNYLRTRDLPGGEYPHALTVGDLDGDHIPDLVAVNVSNTLSVMLGRGDGTFGAKNFGTAISGRSLQTADLDGDGDVDLVATGGDRTQRVATLLGNGDGTFGTSLFFGGWGHSIFATVGDANGDTRPDVAVVSETGNIVSTLLGSGDGTLGPQTDLPTGVAPKGVQIVDLDADGFAELIVANAWPGTLSVFPGTGLGTFGAAVDYETGRFPELLAKSDLNHDGLWDLVVGNAGFATVSVFLGNGDGTLRPRIDLPTGYAPRFASVADMDGDGYLDLAVVAGTSVFLHRGHGDGAFDAGVAVVPHEDAFGVACADLDGDGKLDLAITYPDIRTVSILLGHGDLTFEPPIDLGAHAGGITAADVNHDGRTDLMVASGGFAGRGVTVLLNRTPSEAPAPPPPGVSLLAVSIPAVSRAIGNHLALEVTLPGPGPATLYLLDLAGRVQAARRFESNGPGPQSLTLDARGPLRPGIYFLRLTQAGRVANARTVVLR